MGETFDFNFRYNDGFTTGLGRSAEMVTRFDREIKRVRDDIARMKINPGQFKELASARRELSGLKKEAGGDGRSTGLLSGIASIKNMQGISLAIDGIGLLGDALGAITSVGGKVIGTIGSIAEKFIEATGGEERFRLAADQLFGSVSEDVQAYIDKIAGAGELTDDELKRMVLALKTSGFEAEELGQALPAALDLAGFLGGGVEHVEAATEALAHMRLTGEASARQLKAFGLSSEQVLDRLHETMGLSVAEIKKKMGEGKLDPKALLQAVYHEVAAREGGQLGTMAEKMGKTIEAKLKKLKDLPDQFFQQLVSSKGFDAFEQFLTQLVDELSPDSPFGKQVQAALGEIGDAIAEAFGTKGQGGIATIKTMILDVLQVTRDLIPVMKSLAKIVIGIAKEVSSFYEHVNTRDERAPLEIAPPSIEGGESLIMRPAGGVKPQELTDAERFQYGNFIAPPEPISPLVPSSARAARGGGAVNQKAEININITGGTKEDADEIAGHVQNVMPSALQSFDRMGVNYGAQ